MRFTSLVSVFAAVLAVKAATATDKTAIDAIVKDFERGDILGALGDILTLGSCNVADIADCAATFAPIVVDCGNAAVSQGANVTEDLHCFRDALKAIGPTSGFNKCAGCIEEGISVAEALLEDIHV